MSHHAKHPMDPKTAARMEKIEKRDHRVEHIFRRILHFFGADRRVFDADRPNSRFGF